MAVSLYDISVAAYLQVLGAVEGFLKKGAEHCNKNDIDPADLMETSLYSDMLPLRFQLISVVHHSLGTIKGMQSGTISTPPSMPDLDYAGGQKLIADTRAEVSKVTGATVNALAGKDITFVIGDRKMPFVNEDFVLTFSLPNLHFHATTAYDILRMKGVPLGKRDYLGALRMKSQ